MTLEYAGMHFPNGPVDNETIASLPSPLLLMLASEARYHYDWFRKRGKTVIWRALPRIDRRPVQLGWNVKKCADEVLNLWDEQPHYGIEYFVPYNELDLNYERGDNENDFDGLESRYARIGTFLGDLYTELRKRMPQEVRILYPPFTPDHGDLEHVSMWADGARKYDGFVVHGYEEANRIVQRVKDYLSIFPNKDIFIGEWNAPDQESVLRELATLQAEEPRFKGATYFIWHWHNAPDYWPDKYNVDKNAALENLFRHPPQNETGPVTPEEPMTKQELIDLICRKADEHGLNRVEFLGGAFAESGPNLDQWERWGFWPDVSFGLFHQTVAFADEGDHTSSEQNINYIKSLYFDPSHACDVAAQKFKYWRYNPDVSALTAWCAYNMPSSYHNPESNPNIGNYRRSLELAAQTLGVGLPDGSVTERTFGPDIPDSVILQQNSWSCAVRSTYAALWALSNKGLIEPVTYGDAGPRDVYDWMVPTYDSPSVGLHNADGSGLVKMLGEHGISAGREYPTTLASVQQRAGLQPVLLGGRVWNHWVYVRGVESDGTLILENPAPGFAGIHNILRDSFDRLGPMTMVWIDLPSTPPVGGFEFLFGFKDKADALGRDVVGEPIENEHALDDRFNIQRTTKGIMIYSKVENSVTFIAG